MFSNVNFRQQTGEFAWDEETQGHVLAAYYYGYVATQLMGGRLSEKMGAKMVYGTGIMLSGVFTLMGPVAARAKFYAFIAIRVLTGAASVWPMFKKWGCPERVEKYESSVGLRPIFSRCYIPLSDHHLFLQAQTNFEFTFARKTGTCLLIPIYYRSQAPARRSSGGYVARAQQNLTSGVRCGVNEISALLGCYAALIGCWVTDVLGQPIK